MYAYTRVHIVKKNITYKSNTIKAVLSFGTLKRNEKIFDIVDLP